MSVTMRQGIRSSGWLGSSSRVACQDCGNQAKRDCVYMRCRTCCKTRGFRCQTHVKSTWVPAYRRRHTTHHQLMFDDSSATRQHVELQPSILNLGREHRQENPTISGFEDRPMFPPQITTSAMFQCVMVRSRDADVVEQYAYQTTVVIGGHLFKGILYDQGPDRQHPSAPLPGYTSGEGQPSSSLSPPDRHLETHAPTFATIPPPSAFPSHLQTPLGAISSIPASGTHVFFHQSS